MVCKSLLLVLKKTLCNFIILLISIPMILAMTQSRFSLWIPAGQLVQIPCNLDEEAFRNLTMYVKNLTTYNVLHFKLLMKPQYAITTKWFNSIGRLIHIGSVLSLKLPSTSTGELDLEAVDSRVLMNNSSTSVLRLPINYMSDLGSSLDILQRNTMTTVTCRVYKSNTAGLFRDAYPSSKSTFSLEENLHYSQFALHHSVQPQILWKYAIPNELSKVKDHKHIIIPNRWIQIVKTICKKQQNISEYRKTFCNNVFINRMSSDSIGVYYQLTISITLGRNPLHLLSNPTIASSLNLAHIHAMTKYIFDESLLQEIARELQQIIILKNNTPYAFPTTVEFICPLGSQLHNNTLLLRPIYTRELSDPNSVQQLFLATTSSAYRLIDIIPTCVSCPPGYAQRTPYTFSTCVPCPRGFYRGQTAWPASAGCLSCNVGFSTLTEGSTAPEDCLLDGGVFSRIAIGYAIWAYHNLMELIIAIHEVSSSYTRRVNVYSTDGESLEKVHWLNRINPGALAFGFFYFLFIIFFISIFTYRLSLIIKFSRVHQRHIYTLRKAILLGQLNLQEDARDLLRGEFVDYNGIDKFETKK